MHKKKEKKKPLLETQYDEFFKYYGGLQYGIAPQDDNDSSLEQPSPLQTVPSIVTFGAYEEPLLGT